MASPRSALITVMLVSFLATAGVALPFPMLAPYFLSGSGDPSLVAFLGIHPKLLLGGLIAVYPLGILAGSSFLGAFSDHFGRKRVLVVTLCLGGAGYAATAVAVAAGSYPFFLLARFLTGVCEGNDAVARSIALDLHPHISRTRAISMVFAATYAGWLAGPLIGGYLMFLGMGTVFLLAGAALLFCAGVARFTLSDSTAPQATVPVSALCAPPTPTIRCISGGSRPSARCWCSISSTRWGLTPVTSSTRCGWSSTSAAIRARSAG